jgi:PAT family beta-lactamase induction signal transducer AmpG
MHLPIIGFVLLSPSFIVYYVYATVIADSLIWLCFAAFMMYLIYRRRRVKTSHYALATGFMALGMMLPGMVMDLFKKPRVRKLLYLGVYSHDSRIDFI